MIDLFGRSIDDNYIVDIIIIMQSPWDWAISRPIEDRHNHPIIIIG